MIVSAAWKSGCGTGLTRNKVSFSRIFLLASNQVALSGVDLSAYDVLSISTQGDPRVDYTFYF